VAGGREGRGAREPSAEPTPSIFDGEKPLTPERALHYPTTREAPGDIPGASCCMLTDQTVPYRRALWFCERMLLRASVSVIVNTSMSVLENTSSTTLLDAN